MEQEEAPPPSASSSASTTTTTNSNPTTSAPPKRKLTGKVPPLTLNPQSVVRKDDDNNKNKGSHAYSPRKNKITPRSSRSASARMEEQPVRETSLPDARQLSFCSNIEVARKVTHDHLDLLALINVLFHSAQIGFT